MNNINNIKQSKITYQNLFRERERERESKIMTEWKSFDIKRVEKAKVSNLPGDSQVLFSYLLFNTYWWNYHFVK